jgi:hypothetical protein
VSALELYDRDGRLVRSIPATQDNHDATKWILAERVSFDTREVETAVFRFGDGTSQPVPPSMFPSSVPINTLFLSVPTTPDPDDPDEPVNSL